MKKHIVTDPAVTECSASEHTATKLPSYQVLSTIRGKEGGTEGLDTNDAECDKQNGNHALARYTAKQNKTINNCSKQSYVKIINERIENTMLKYAEDRHTCHCRKLLKFNMLYLGIERVSDLAVWSS